MIPPLFIKKNFIISYFLISFCGSTLLHLIEMKNEMKWNGLFAQQIMKLDTIFRWDRWEVFDPGDQF